MGNERYSFARATVLRQQDVRKRIDSGTETEVFQAQQAGGRFLAGGYVR
jgi:hypothetical protein